VVAVLQAMIQLGDVLIAKPKSSKNKYDDFKTLRIKQGFWKSCKIRSCRGLRNKKSPALCKASQVSEGIFQ
jgi:hypothetical protein